MALTTRPTDPNNPDQEKERQEREERQQRPPPYSPASRPGVEAPEQEDNSAAKASKGEQSQPSGQQDATLPGETSETSDQMPKPGESSAKGKGPLKFDPNAPAVETVAQKDKMQVEGETVDIPPEEQIHSSAVPPKRDPDKAWQDYATQSVNSLYPRLRDGVDFAIGRKTIDGDVELLSGQDKGIDWGKVEENARVMAAANPIGDNYQPGPSLAPAPETRGHGEVSEAHSYDDIAQSGGNPSPSTHRGPGGEAVPVSRQQPSGTVNPPQQQSPNTRPQQSQQSARQYRPGTVNMPPQQPKPPQDPNFNPDGTRKRKP